MLQHQTLRHTLLGRAKEHLRFHPFGLEHLLYVLLCKLVVFFFFYIDGQLVLLLPNYSEAVTLTVHFCTQKLLLVLNFEFLLQFP